MIKADLLSDSFNYLKATEGSYSRKADLEFSGVLVDMLLHLGGLCGDAAGFGIWVKWLVGGL